MCSLEAFQFFFLLRSNGLERGYSEFERLF